jgi:cytoskeletal protein RodZ
MDENYAALQIKGNVPFKYRHPFMSTVFSSLLFIGILGISGFWFWPNIVRWSEPLVSFQAPVQKATAKLQEKSAEADPSAHSITHSENSRELISQAVAVLRRSEARINFTKNSPEMEYYRVHQRNLTIAVSEIESAINKLARSSEEIQSAEETMTKK